MGSRYGGLKQLDPMGPSGETLLDYSVFDALRAGFGGVTFVIRKDFENDFREKVGKQYEHKTDVRYAFQQLDMLPEGFSVPQNREKPWGTTHAIWCARDIIKEPFAAINADDFYGAPAYKTLCEFLANSEHDSMPEFAMVAYQLKKTLSEHGTVSRGICEINANGHLTHIVERTAIERTANGAQQKQPDGSVINFTGDEPVSMNFWGFTPEIFPMLEADLIDFLKERGGELKSESFIPNTVGEFIKQDTADCRVLKSNSGWFGVTYRDDKERVEESIRKLVAAGEYPENLWD